MARPAYRDDQPTARERMREAFWELLEHEGYGRITVKALASQANVNPNTFYYHYASMEDLARDALDAEKLSEIPEAIRDSASGGVPLPEALAYVAVGGRWGRVRMFVASDSAALRAMFYETLEGFWLQVLGIEKEGLAPEDALDLAFMVNGAMGVIALQGDEYDPSFLRSLPERELGRGIMRALGRMVERYAS